MCDKPVDGHKICFDCMFDLAEEERLLRIKNSKWNPRGGTSCHAFSPSPRVSQSCTHCWPFDCGCSL